MEGHDGRKMTYSTMNNGAIITTIKQYEFCDDIKKNILSYLCPKKMKSINPNLRLFWKWNGFDRSHYWERCDNFKGKINTICYKMNIMFGKEQLLFETSPLGLKMREHLKQRCRKWDLGDQIKKEEGWGFAPRRIQLHDDCWKMPKEMLERFFHSKEKFLKEIQVWGTRYVMRMNKREQRKRANVKRRERVCCELCGKTLSKNSISKHMKNISLQICVV